MEYDAILTRPALAAGNCCVLRQGRELLERLDQRLYVGRKPPYFSHSVGGHFRHVLDFNKCFLAGLGAGRIDYDRRERNGPVENDRAAAIAGLGLMIDLLEGLSADGDTPVLVRLEAAAPEPDSSPWACSSVGRELQFLLSHTVHHYALIAVLLRLQGFEPPAEFGVAPSTLEYWRRDARCAR